MEPEKTPFMDRRKYTRLAKTLVVRCARLSLPPNPAPAESHWLASTVDISEGGVLLRSPERLRLGEGLEILFELEPSKPPVQVNGNVVRYHVVMYDKIYYVPIAYTSISPEARKRIQDYAERNASPSGSAPNSASNSAS